MPRHDSPYSDAPLINAPTKTGWYDRETADQLARALNITSQDTSTLLVARGPDGPTLLVIGGAASGGYLVKITGDHPDSPSEDGEIYYYGDVYGNGPRNEPTIENVLIRCVQIASGERVGANTWWQSVKYENQPDPDAESESSSGDTQITTYWITPEAWL